MASRLECVLTRGPRTKPGILPQAFYFQTGPIESFAFESIAEWSDYDTLGRKRFSRPNSVQLIPIAFDTVFMDYLFEEVPAALQQYVRNLSALGLPATAIDGVSTHPYFAPPEARVVELRAIQRSLTPVILTIADSDVLRAPAAPSVGLNTSSQLSLEVTLRNVRDEQRAGEPDARYVNVQFVQYAPIELAQSKRGGTKGTAGTTKLTIRSLKDDEITVARLARKYYGDASKVASIYALNKPWLQEIARNENLRAIALGTVTQTTRNKRLKALLKKHPQIIVPALKGAAASTRLTGTTYVGEIGGV